MRKMYQEHELEAYLGDHAEDFDVEAIVDEATETDYRTGDRYWKDGIDLAEICERHDTTQAAVEVKTVYVDGHAEKYDEYVPAPSLDTRVSQLRNDAWAGEFPFDDDDIAEVWIDGCRIV